MNNVILFAGPSSPLLVVGRGGTVWRPDPPAHYTARKQRQRSGFIPQKYSVKILTLFSALYQPYQPQGSLGGCQSAEFDCVIMTLSRTAGRSARSVFRGHVAQAVGMQTTSAFGQVGQGASLHTSAAVASDESGAGKSEMELLVQEMQTGLRANDDAMLEEVQEDSPLACAEYVMRHWHERPQRQFFLPALQRFAEQENFYANLADRATAIGFLSEALRSEGNDSQKMLGLQIPLLTKIEVVDVLASFHQLDPTHRLDAYKALRKNFDMGGDPSAVSLLKGLDAAPVKPFHQWPLPHSADDVEFEEFMDEFQQPAGKSVFDLSVVSALMRQTMLNQWKTLKEAEANGTLPAAAAAADGEEDASPDEPRTPDDVLVQFGSMIGMWMNGALYGAFCATGDHAYIKRWVDAAVPFAAFMDGEDWLGLVVDHNSPPSPTLQAKLDNSERPALAKLRFELSRFAFWQLLMYSNFSDAYMAVVAGECAKLAPWATRPKDADKNVRAQMTAQEARARLQVLPALLSMMSKHATSHYAGSRQELPLAGPWRDER